VTVKNILFISYDGMTDPLGQSQVLPYLCGLSAKGYKIHLISAEKKENYRRIRHIIQDICSGSSISWYPIRYSRFPPIICTISDLLKVNRKASKLHKLHHFNLIHCRSYLAALNGAYLKKKFGIPFLFDMRGLWADEKLDGNIWDLRNPVYRAIYDFFKRKEKEFLLNADGIISLTHKAWPVLEKSAGTMPDKQIRATIPCCSDEQLFNPQSITENTTQQRKAKSGISNHDFILVYLGSISTWYLPAEMLHFFKLLLSTKPNARFLIISTENPNIILNTAREMGIPEGCVIVTSSNRRELPSLLRMANLGVCFIKPAFSKIASSPTKLGELLCMGIPVVCNKGIGDTDEIVQNLEAGSLCDPYDEQSMRDSILTVLHMHEKGKFNDLRSRAISFFSLNRGVDIYSGVYQKLTDQA